MTRDYLQENVPCCSGCFCEHNQDTIDSWNADARRSYEAYQKQKAEADVRAAARDAERVAALHEHLAKYQR